MWVRYCAVLFVFILLITIPVSHIQVGAGDVGDDARSTNSTSLDGYILRPPESPPTQSVLRNDSDLLSPDLAVGANGTVHAVWVETFNYHKSEVRYSRSNDGGGTWTKSVALSTNLMMYTDLPDVVADGNGNVVVTWREEIDYKYRCYVRMSRDGGRSFGPVSAVPPLLDFPDCKHARAAITEDGSTYLVCSNSRERDGSASDNYALGLCRIDGSGRSSSQQFLSELGLSRQMVTLDVCARNNDELVCAYTYNYRPYVTTVPVNGTTFSGDPLPRSGSTSAGCMMELVRYGNETHVLFVTRDGSRAYLDHVWAKDGNKVFLKEQLLRESFNPSSQIPYLLLDSAVSEEGRLQSLVGTRYNNTVLLLSRSLTELSDGPRVQELYIDEHNRRDGGSLAPHSGPENTTLLCTPIVIDGEAPKDHVLVLEAIVWNWSSSKEETASYVGRDSMYVSDRTDVHVEYGPDGTVHAVWCEPRGYAVDEWNYENVVYYSRRPAGSSDFKTPIRLNPTNMSNFIYSALDIGISTNGTVYVVWYQVDDFGPPYGIGTYLVGTLSSDNGTTWSYPVVVWEGISNSGPAYNDEVIHIEAAPNGSMFLTTMMDWPLDWDYRRTLVLVAWNDDFDVFIKEGLQTVITYGYRYDMISGASLAISSDGNPHVVYYERKPFPESTGQVMWLRSLDGGFTWESPENLTMGTVPRAPFRGVIALGSDERITMAITISDESEKPLNTSLRWLMRDLDENLSIFKEVVDNRSLHSPIHGAISIRMDPNNTSTITYLGVDISAASDGFGRYSTNLYSVRVDSTGAVGSPTLLSEDPSGAQLDLEMHYGVVLDSSLDMCYESNGAPVIGAILVDDEAGRLGVYVWRTNHLPALQNLSETDGEWVLGPDISLDIRPPTDPDGDVLELRFSVWSPDGIFNVSSVWQSSNSFSPKGLDHGAYCWSVEVRDPFESVGSDPGWWFRYDGRGPSADASGPYITSEGSPILLTGAGSSDDGPISLWEWDLDGDGVFEHGSTNPTMVFPAIDDFQGNITLRVTDEAGRMDTDIATLVVLNSPPTCALTGHEHLTVGDTAYLGLKVMDDGALDTHTITWYGEEGPIGEGTNVTVFLSNPGPYLISVMVEDDDGGVCSKQYYLTVNHIPLYVEIQHPSSVWVGDEYRVYITDNYPVPLQTLNVTWYVDNEVMGFGREVWLKEDTPGEREIRVSAKDPVGHTSTDSGTVTVRERLEPVVILGPTDIANDSITIEWTECEQVHAFDRYWVVISKWPLTSPPTLPTLWVVPGGVKGFYLYNVSSTIMSFPSLESNTTYYIRVDVVGDGQRSFSNVYAVRTVVDTFSPEPEPLDEVEGDWMTPGLFMIIVLILVVMITIVATAMYIRYRDGTDRE